MEIKGTVKIKLDNGQHLTLSMEEAEALYEELKSFLKKSDTIFIPYYPTYPIYPEYPYRWDSSSTPMITWETTTAATDNITTANGRVPRDRVEKQFTSEDLPNTVY